MAYRPLNPGDKLSARYVYEELTRVAAALDEITATSSTTTIAVPPDGKPVAAVAISGVTASIIEDPIEFIWLPAQSFAPFFGSPVVGLLGSARRHMYFFDAASTEAIEAGALVPVGWSDVSVSMFWTNAGAGAGNVIWYVDGLEVAPGTTLDTADSLNSVAHTLTATTQSILLESSMGTFSGLTAGRYLLVRPKRFGGEAGDTLGNDAGLLGVKLTKA